jgi:hypothetical protein
MILVAMGIGVYPILYGFVFDYIQVASAVSGAAMGLANALALILAASLRQRVRPASPLRTVALYVAYGAVLGFLYVTP